MRATRELPEVSIGGSVRGSLALERASRAWALLDGRAYTTPEDVERMFAPVLGHRLVFSPSFIAESRGRSRDEIVNEVYGRCVELAPPPDLADVARRTDGDVDVAELSFPLVPRWRPVGSAFGRLRAARRGHRVERRHHPLVPCPATTRA